MASESQPSGNGSNATSGVPTRDRPETAAAYAEAIDAATAYRRVRMKTLNERLVARAEARRREILARLVE